MTLSCCCSARLPRDEYDVVFLHWLQRQDIWTNHEQDMGHSLTQIKAVYSPAVRLARYSKCASDVVCPLFVRDALRKVRGRGNTKGIYHLMV